MPQLDKITFMLQTVTISFCFFITYFIFVIYFLPEITLGIKQRELLIKSLINEISLINFLVKRFVLFTNHLTLFTKNTFVYTNFFKTSFYIELLKYNIINIESKFLMKTYKTFYFKYLLMNNLSKFNNYKKKGFDNLYIFFK